jgi:hypothetical protein
VWSGGCGGGVDLDWKNNTDRLLGVFRGLVASVAVFTSSFRAERILVTEAFDGVIGGSGNASTAKDDDDEDDNESPGNKTPGNDTTIRRKTIVGSSVGVVEFPFDGNRRDFIIVLAAGGWFCACVARGL